MDRAGERHQDHAAPRVQRIVGRRPRPPALRPLGRPVHPRAHIQRLVLGRNPHEAQQVPQPRLRVERLVGVENPDLLGVARRQLARVPVIFVPVAANAFLPVLCVELRKRPRAVRVVVPAGGGPPGPMVRRQRHRLVEPLAEARHDLLPRTLEAHDPDIGLRNSLFQVRQVERRHVAQNRTLACDRKRANRSRSTRRASDPRHGSSGGSSQSTPCRAAG